MTGGPIRFSRGASLYQIAPSYTEEVGFIGIRDGRVVAKAADKAQVASAMIRAADHVNRKASLTQSSR